MDDQPSQMPDDASDDLLLEVTPLSPLPGSQHTRSRMRLWQAAIIGGVIVIALAVIFSRYLPFRTPLTGSALPQPTATNTPEPTPVVFGKVPTNCPPGNPVETFSPSYAPGVVVADMHIWLVGFVGPQATARFTSARLTPYGWPYKLLVVAAPEITQPIALSANGMGDVAGSVTFSMGSLDNATTPLILNPQLAPPQADGWRSWVTYIFLPASGCYYLDVQYGGQEQSGTWFAAGL